MGYIARACAAFDRARMLTRASSKVVVSDKRDCGATAYASKHGIACVRHPDPGVDGVEATTTDLAQALSERHRIDYVLLAGYMKLVPPEVVKAYPRAMLNIHPALLPSFGGKGCYGMRVHRAVVDAGVRYTGATVHFVSEVYDEGPILAQACVPVYPDDNPDRVAARVLKQEHELYPEAVAALCDGRVHWREDGVPFVRRDV